MNLPNKLTVFRMILIVPFLLLLLGGHAGWFGGFTPWGDYVALAIFVLGVAAAAYGLYSVFSHTGSYGVYFALFGFAAIFLFSSYNMLPTAHNNNNAIMKRADKAEAAMAEYVKHYPHGAFPVKSWYAHPIVLKRMMDAIEEGNAVTVPEALDAVKARLKSLNADVQVEQEEYDEVVVIKALFLNHDYQ